jgi:hypothetical protein
MYGHVQGFSLFAVFRMSPARLVKAMVTGSTQQNAAVFQLSLVILKSL